MEHVLGLPLGTFLMKNPSAACVNYAMRDFGVFFPPYFEFGILLMWLELLLRALQDYPRAVSNLQVLKCSVDE